MPTRVACAASNEVNPSMGRVTRLTPAMVLFDNIIQIFDLTDLIAVPCSSLKRLMAASLAALPSMVIFSGTP